MTKELYVVSRDVILGATVGKHSGYMLVEKDDLGNIINVQTVDLKGGFISDIEFEYCASSQGNFYLPNGSVVPGRVNVGGNWEDTNSQWVMENNYKSKIVGDLLNAEDVFNKIKQHAQAIDYLRENGFSIDYRPLDQNCNTWSKYVAELYLNGFDIFDLLNEGVNPPETYVGSEDNFPYLPVGEDAVAANLLAEVLGILEDNGLSLSDVDLQIERNFFDVILAFDAEEFHYEKKVRTYAVSTAIDKGIVEPLQASFALAHEMASPLILDLDGDGVVETKNRGEGIYFDHDGSGFSESSGWVGKDDGLLVRDINNNGQIDNGAELFGNNSVLANGQKAANGFEALKDLDSNNDNYVEFGVIEKTCA